MSEKMTTITIKGDDGLMLYGYQTRAYMIDQYRKHAQIRYDEAVCVLNASDDQFTVEQHRGIDVRHDVVELKPTIDAAMAQLTARAGEVAK